MYSMILEVKFAYVVFIYALPRPQALIKKFYASHYMKGSGIWAFWLAMLQAHNSLRLFVAMHYFI
jgi:hypothetical protein